MVKKKQEKEKDKQMMDSVSIRTATINDAESLAAIYAPYVERTAITFEYAAPTTEEFRRRIANTLESYPYLVAECSGTVVVLTSDISSF